MMPSAGLIVRREARDLRRAVRPVVWVVLEEVVLDAVAGDGGLVAATSARSIAWRLGLDPGTAASALRTLRDRGLVELIRVPGPSGRFGLSMYRLGRIPGVELLGPRGDGPHVDASGAVDTDTVHLTRPTRKAPRQHPPSCADEKT
jgi:DNA-binding transcriptional ArsR family regulator